MEEKKIFVEIPGGKNSFHSAVLTSFSFNFHHFEYQVLKTLRNKWISSINVLVDQRMLDNILGFASGNLKQLSKSYSVTGIKSNGAFHPKINFFIGDEKVLLVFGSGNITPSGHGKNHELFTGFYADSENSNQLNLINEAWNYITNIADNLHGYSKNRIKKVIPQNCSLLNNDIQQKHLFYKLDEDIEVALLYNEETSIFEQLNDLIPKEDVQRITIFCPFFDEDGKTLINLLGHYSNSNMEVYLSDDFGIPPVKMIDNDRVKFYSWEKTLRGEKTISGDYVRKLHAKIIHFESEDTEYCLIGSANATIKALGSFSVKPANYEFGALYKTNNIDFLKQLGVTGIKQQINLKNQRGLPNIYDKPEVFGTIKTIHITSSDLIGNKLKVFIKKKDELIDANICVYNENAILIDKIPINNAINDTLVHNLTSETLKQNPTFTIIENNTGESLSNKQTINFVDKLENTNPSKGNRNLRQILNAIDGGNINEFEIIEYINNIHDPSNNKKENLSRINNSESSNDDTAELTYEEVVSLAKDAQQNENILNNHFSVRLWETLSNLFKEKSSNIGEELMDEEEEGNANSGRDRSPSTSDDRKYIIKNKSNEEKIINNAEKLATNYVKSLSKVRSLGEKDINIVDLSQFLLTSHVLTAVLYFTEFELSENINQIKWNKRIKELYESLMTDILVNFAKTCINRKLVEYEEDNDYLRERLKGFKEKALNHAFLYIHLIERRCKEQVIADKLNMSALNLLLYLGRPGKEFSTYIHEMSKADNDSYFNPAQVVAQKDKIIEIFREPDMKNEFIGLAHSGICKIIEKSGDKIIYKRLHDDSKHTISKTKLKDYMIDFNKWN